MGFFSGALGDGAERAIFKKSCTVIRHGIKANAHLAKIIEGKIEYCGRMKVVENSADREVFELVTEITGGAVAPNLIADLTHFIDQEDEIVDNIFALSKALCRYRIKDRKANRYVKARLLKTTALIDKSLDLLIEMQNAEKISEMRHMRAQIQAYEREDDELKDALLDFAYSSRLDYKDFYQATELAYISDNVLDLCEDASNMLLSIMQSILT